MKWMRLVQQASFTGHIFSLQLVAVEREKKNYSHACTDSSVKREDKSFFWGGGWKWFEWHSVLLFTLQTPVDRECD